MTGKALADRVRNRLPNDFRTKFKVTTELVRPNDPYTIIRVSPIGRRRDLLKESHNIYPVLAGQLIPFLRKQGFNVMIDGYNSNFENAPIDIDILGG